MTEKFIWSNVHYGSGWLHHGHLTQRIITHPLVVYTIFTSLNVSLQNLVIIAVLPTLAGPAVTRVTEGPWPGPCTWQPRYIDIRSLTQVSPGIESHCFVMCLVWNSLAQVWPDQHCVCVPITGFLSPLLTVYIPINYCNSDKSDHPLTRNANPVCSLCELSYTFVIVFLWQESWTWNILFTVYLCLRYHVWLTHFCCLMKVTCALPHIPNSTEPRCDKCMNSSRNPRLWLAPSPRHVIRPANGKAAPSQQWDCLCVHCTAKYPSHTKHRICEVSIKILLE